MVDHKIIIKRIPEPIIKRYHMKKTSSGKVWLWLGYQPAGDHVYCGFEDPETSDEGVGKRTRYFRLMDNDVIELFGSWHTNDRALKAATGIDLTQQHLTFVVIGAGVSYGYGAWNGVIHDVVYQDDEWQVSHLNRGKELAKKFANKLGHYVVCYQQSAERSICGPVLPDKKE